MNKIALLSSFIIILIAHYVALTFLYEKKVPEVTKPPYQKVSVQLAQVKLPTPVKKIEKPIEKPIEKKVEPKPIEKPIVEKKVFKKPIKKDAKRKIVKKIEKKKVVKKPIKKVVKKEPIKKPVKKVVKKEPVKKPVVEKKIEKVVEKPIEKPTQEVKKVEQNTAAKAAAQSLEKFKKFKKSYLTALRAAIDRNKKYPIVSKRLEEQGLVTLSFRVVKTGAFHDIKLIKSSGKKRLDKAALKAIKATANFRAFDKEIKKEYMDITVPIKFQLNK